MKKYFIEKLKALRQLFVMCWFSSPDKFIKWYLIKKHGSVQLNDGTWAVHQSDEFHKWCYNEGYKCWKETNT